MRHLLYRLLAADPADIAVRHLAAIARALDTWVRSLRPSRAVREWLALPARLVMPHQGRHRDKCPLTPAPAPARAPAPAVGPGQGRPRPGDPPNQSGERGAARAVRAGARDAPVPYWPAYLPAPAPAAAPGQAQAPACSPAPEAAPWPGAELPRPRAVPPSAGPGRHSFDGRPPWTPFPPCPGEPVTWNRADGSRVIIGWGPKAEIPAPYAQARVTGAHAIIAGSAPLVPRWYAAHEARRDAVAVAR